MLKHDKPHMCDILPCKRAALGKGFTTINDLDRHKKSVHRIGVNKDSYQCASENCRNKQKLWPRLDNFKQHISRMHKGEDEADLINRYVPPDGDAINVVQSVDHSADRLTMGRILPSCQWLPWIPLWPE